MKQNSNEVNTLTPMMRQYRSIHDEIGPDVILMFRLGDFYEMFFEDSIRAAPILGVALTKRNNYPMCGIPYHAKGQYLVKLLRANITVAVCDQLEDPKTIRPGQIVRRGITRIITPGTVDEEALLREDANLFLVSMQFHDGVYGAAMLDLSTGTFLIEDMATPEALHHCLRRVQAREVLLPEDGPHRAALLEIAHGADVKCTSSIETWHFDPEIAQGDLARHFGVSSLAGFGCEGHPAAVGAANALLHYVEKLHNSTSHITSIRLCRQASVLLLDEATCAHLDLLPTRGKPAQETLFGVLNSTRTPMGARLLRHWIEQPLRDVAQITSRHEAVASFVGHRAALSRIRDNMGSVRDLERLAAKVALGRGNARDLLAIAGSLECVPALRTDFLPVAGDGFRQTADDLLPLPDIAGQIRSTLVDEPPATLDEGGLIRPGFSETLDKLRLLATNGREWIAQYLATLVERTGIRTLKIKHTNVFGYFIEVPTSQVSLVPEDFVRRQTTANAERYTTPELKEYEEKIFTAHDESVRLECEIFAALRADVVSRIADIQRTAAAIATLDVLASLADRALALGYVRPEMADDLRIDIRDGRHPIVEQLPDAERFVPNDTMLNGDTQQIMVITGPNMAGKSTYIRQVAVIVVMAQLGSFVPAASAHIGVVDRVFTRVGASDDLARGRSTFMVEMQETANILNNATARSLVVLDEIGRGTSTFDGISIAWAVAEYLHNTPGVKARTLFATHYHELTNLARELPGVKNFCVKVAEQGHGIAFLRRIVPGAADKSYGIAVAKLAGMPRSVVQRANEVLANLEDGEFDEAGQASFAQIRDPTDPAIKYRKRPAGAEPASTAASGAVSGTLPQAPSDDGNAMPQPVQLELF